MHKSSSHPIYKRKRDGGRNQGNNTFHSNFKKKNRRYIGVVLAREVKDLYNKNFKTLRKEIEKGIRRRSPILMINEITRFQTLYRDIGVEKKHDIGTKPNTD